MPECCVTLVTQQVAQIDDLEVQVESEKAQKESWEAKATAQAQAIQTLRAALEGLLEAIDSTSGLPEPGRVAIARAALKDAPP